MDVKEPIAIIGIGCRFPGAPNPHAFWKLLREGVDAVREVPADRWDVNTLYDPDPSSPGKMITRWGGFIDDVDRFDWRAFRILPREAKYVDPQHRILLEVAWEALEDAGLPLEKVAGSRTGVFMGIMWNDYLRLQASDLSQLTGYGPTGNAFAFAPNRISYTFDLRGPSVAIDSACAASLASVHAACQSLWLAEATLALAGGVNLIISPDVNIMLSKAGLLSPEGRCKTLDARADGFVRGEGAGIVVLKPLSQLTSSDRVYALIRGTAMNHNGHNEWIMAASPAAQEAVLRDAYRMAGIDPAEVDYVELHGTGLPKGDPIEAKSVGRVIGTRPGRDHPCLIGSVKTNIGHLDSAAGIASLIKVALSLYHRQIPPTLHLQEVNSNIPLEELGLAAQQTLSPWPNKTGPALAGVTAISMAGVNAHMVLEGPPQDPNNHLCAEQLGFEQAQLLPISARSSEALTALAQAFKDFLTDEGFGISYSLSDVCYTASVRRSHHQHRLAFVGHSRQTFVEALDAFLRGKPLAGTFSQQGVADNQNVFLASSQNPILAEAMAECLMHRDQAGNVLPSLLEEGEDRRIKLETLAALYVQGYTLDWSALYPDENKCVQLPVYPWQRERLWLDWLENPNVSEGPDHRLVTQSSDEATGRPLLGRHTELAYPAGTHIWEIGLTKQTLPNLTNHQGQENSGLPDTLCRKVVLSAAVEALGTGSYSLEDLEIREPLADLEAGLQTVQLIFTSDEAGKASFQLFSLRKSDQEEAPSWTLHAVGQVGRAQVEHIIQPAEERLGTRSEFLRQLTKAPPNQRQALLLVHIQEEVSAVLGLDSTHPLKPQQKLFDAGLNSFAIVELMSRLQTSLGYPLPTTLIFSYPTMESLTEYLVEEVLFPEANETSYPPSSNSSGGEDIPPLTGLEQISEDEAEALLLKKLEVIERGLR